MKVPTSSAIPAPLMCESSIWLPYRPPPPDSSSFSSIARRVPRRTVSSILASSSKPTPPRKSSDPARRVPIRTLSTSYRPASTRALGGRPGSASRLGSASLLSLSKSILMPPTRVFVEISRCFSKSLQISELRADRDHQGPPFDVTSLCRRLEAAPCGVVLDVYLLTPYVLLHNLCVLYHVLLDPYLFLGHRPL